MDVITLGRTVRAARKNLGVTQTELALMADTGRRFIVDLENGKPSCELGRTLRVLAALGLKVRIE